LARTTIDYGIDLGTTNSCVAVLKGTETEIIKINGRYDLTPSAVWIDGKGRLYVGQNAKDRLVSDAKNAYSEFKLHMGTAHTVNFEAANRIMRPEELSAEVLKCLRAGVEKEKKENINAAVITVPAEFDLPENEATRKAAQLAGFSVTPLVLEPVAAALAYGFQSDSDRVFWLVYDMGGGTFDAAIINMRDGDIRIVNHGGVKHLGGKQIDWDIVNQILVPEITGKYSLANFEIGNKRWETAFAKLKEAAEEAKIQLSWDDSYQIMIDSLCKDDSGNVVSFEYEIERGQIETLVEPYVERSINICKKVMEEKRLDAGNIEKILLVGGPSHIPILRDMLSNRLEIPLEFGIDPLTVVARGAAVFAGTQRVGESFSPGTPAAGKYQIQLQYEPVGSDPEPQIGGRVIAESLAGLTIEFVELKSQWRSGKINLTPNGAFMTNLRAEKGRMNEFVIELRDSAGNSLDTVPDRITYIIGITPTNAILTHSVGVAQSNNEMDVFIGKGTALPAKSPRKVHYTTTRVQRGDSSTFLRIPVVEGGNLKRADRNRRIGNLEITGDKIKRDIPVGSEVEIIIEIDESRQTRAEAYIPVIDDILNISFVDDKKLPALDQLQKEIEQEKARLEKVSAQSKDLDSDKSEVILQRIRCEQTVQQMDKAITAARAGDQNAAHECRDLIHDLQTSIDEVEDNFEWPNLIEKAREEIEETRKILDEYGNSGERKQFEALENEVEKFIAAGDPDLLRRKVDELSRLKIRVLTGQIGFWIGYLQYLTERKSHMSDPVLAEHLFSQGARAINNNDPDELKRCVLRLIELLPKEEQEEAKGFGGTTISR
jgi:molecular chaperone DnaK